MDRQRDVCTAGVLSAHETAGKLLPLGQGSYKSSHSSAAGVEGVEEWRSMGYPVAHT